VASDLERLNGRWADWEVETWDLRALRVIADNNLTYHHEVEVSFLAAEYVACPSSFSHPVFRDATAEEIDRVRRLNGGLGSLTVFVWDLDDDPVAGPCVVAAQVVSIVERHVRHEGNWTWTKPV
jgi:hypothetical protein